MWGIFAKPLERAIWNTLGLDAVLTTCLRFSSDAKTIRPKTALFPSENRAILGLIVFMWRPAFSHIGEIDRGLRLILRPFSSRFQKGNTYHHLGNEILVHWPEMPEKVQFCYTLTKLAALVKNSHFTPKNSPSQPFGPHTMEIPWKHSLSFC